MLRLLILGLALALLGGDHDKKDDRDGPGRGHQARAKAAAKHQPKAAAKHQPKAASQDRHKVQKSDRDMNTRPVGARDDGGGGPRAKIGDRQDNQKRRIRNGVQNGSITRKELAEQRDRQKAIEQARLSFRGDGKTTRDEREQLHKLLDDSSRAIWADRHDEEGRQLSVRVFGKNVFASPEILRRISDPNLTAAEAHKIMDDYRQMFRCREQLRTPGIDPDQRKQIRAQYHDLLRRYFEVRKPNQGDAT